MRRLAQTRHNFSNLAPWVDVVFGTYHCPEGPETYPLGLMEPFSSSYVAQLVHPVRPRRLPAVNANASGDRG